MIRQYLWIVIFVLGACSVRAQPAVTGVYDHTGAIAATMTVRVQNGIADIMLEGGGNRSAGESSAADCGIHAVGPVTPAGIVAAFHAMQSDTMDYDETLARREHRKLRVTFSKRGAQVVAADIDGYCGLGADFNGPYKRR